HADVRGLRAQDDRHDELERRVVRELGLRVRVLFGEAPERLRRDRRSALQGPASLGAFDSRHLGSRGRLAQLSSLGGGGTLPPFVPSGGGGSIEVLLPSSTTSLSASRSPATMRSPSASVMRRTPWALRLVSRISSTHMRMVCPRSVMSMTSSPACTSFTPTTGPFRSLASMRMIPLPPRFWVRNSSMCVRLPEPFAHVAST